MTPGVDAGADRYMSEGLTVTSYGNFDEWVSAGQSASNGSAASNGSGTPSSVVADDCLVLVGQLEDFVRRGLPERILKSYPGLVVAVFAPGPTLATATPLLRQGAYAVIDLNDTDAAAVALREAANHGRATLPLRRRLGALRDRLAQLTSPERQVLDAMLDGMANKQIAQLLEIGLRTVELRRSKIMKKMHARSLAELIKFVCQATPEIAAESPANVDAPQVSTL